MTDLAFLFPGQGSQRVGMGRSIAAAYSIAKQTFEEADDVLGFGLSRLCWAGPEDVLRRTDICQLALLTTSVATLRALVGETGLACNYVAGHSLGEYSAHVCARTLTFERALRLVQKRGQCMNDAAAPDHAMAAIRLMDLRRLQAVIDDVRAGDVLEIACSNSPTQQVIGGTSEAVQRARSVAEKSGAATALLSVSGAFHTSFMDLAAEYLSPALVKTLWQTPAVPICANANGALIRDPCEIPELLALQMTSVVRWEQSIRYLIGLGVGRFIEIGCGDTLCNLIREIDTGVVSDCVETAGCIDRVRSWMETGELANNIVEEGSHLKEDGAVARDDGSMIEWRDGVVWDSDQYRGYAVV